MVDEGLREGFEPHDVPEPSLEGRTDFRELTTFTIDPDTAKDFDDAISVRREGDGVRVWVHIADVSYFVPAGSPLDRGAEQRGNSVYVPGLVAPMLPHELADEACSLRPNEDRLDGDRRVRAGRDAELPPLRDPQPGALYVRPGAADPRGQGAARARRRRPARGQRVGRASPSPLRPRRAPGRAPGGQLRVRRARRGRACLARGRAECPCADRGADDPRQRGRGRIHRGAQGEVALPGPRAARAAVGRAPALEAGRPRGSDPAGAEVREHEPVGRGAGRGRGERARDRVRQDRRAWEGGLSRHSSCAR